MLVEVCHRTRYEYESEVLLGVHQLMLRPREGVDLQLLSFDLEIRPEGRIRWGRDVFGNWVTWVLFRDKAKVLEVVSRSKVRLQSLEGGDRGSAENLREFPFGYDAEEQKDLEPYLKLEYEEDRMVIRQWLGQLWRPMQRVDVSELLSLLVRKIHTEFAYQRRDEMGVQSPGETLRRRRGSCRDFAVLCMESCRALGIASRFVSGYILPANGESMEHGSTHAWAEVYLPGMGWIGMDPTIGEWCDHNHVAVAATRHALQAAPVSGYFGGNATAYRGLFVDVSIRLIE